MSYLAVLNCIRNSLILSGMMTLGLPMHHMLIICRLQLVSTVCVESETHTTRGSKLLCQMSNRFSEFLAFTAIKRTSSTKTRMTFPTTPCWLHNFGNLEDLVNRVLTSQKSRLKAFVMRSLKQNVVSKCLSWQIMFVIQSSCLPGP